jgi:hypothetical protein
MELTLEQELQARIFVHKTALVGGYIMQDFINKEMAKGGITLSLPLVQRMADEYSNRVMQHALRTGTFDDLYNKIWEKIAPIIPDNTKVL